MTIVCLNSLIIFGISLQLNFNHFQFFLFRRVNLFKFRQSFLDYFEAFRSVMLVTDVTQNCRKDYKKFNLNELEFIFFARTLFYYVLGLGEMS